LILEKITAIQKHAHLHPGFQLVADYIQLHDLNSLSLGKHHVADDSIFVIIEECKGRGQNGARLEAHRAYIDIQLCLTGNDLIGVKAITECKSVSVPYDSERDIIFFADEAETWITIDTETCAILFPEDAHAPLATEGKIKKAVFKIKV